jgi:hypothetical protein
MGVDRGFGCPLERLQENGSLMTEFHCSQPNSDVPIRHRNKIAS